MYQPPSGTQKTEQMWPLPVDLFGLAREIHTQILNDFGAKDPWSAPFVGCCLPCAWAPGWTKGWKMGSLPSWGLVWEGRQGPKYTFRQQVRREKADWLVPQESMIPRAQYRTGARVRGCSSCKEKGLRRLEKALGTLAKT